MTTIRHPARRRLAALALLALAGLLVLAGAAAAQEPDGGEPDAVLANVGTAFTYQGRLNDGGSPASGAYDFEFRLYDALSAGSQIGSTVTLDDVSVSNGLFTVRLDFGATPFRGDARWLEIQVRAGASGGPYTALSPRQALTAAPYALSLRPGAQINGTAGTILQLSGGTTGLSTSGDTYGAYGQSASTSGSGVYGESVGTYSHGVHGVATASSGTTTGVYGRSYSTDGFGMHGHASASSGATVGVYGTSYSTSGIGVSGYASQSSGTTYGMYGQSSSTAGTGVYGIASASSGTTYGVYGETASSGGYGIYGYATATSGLNRGVAGRTESSNGYGVIGYAAATSGANRGVYGRSDSTDGYGVFGWNTATSGNNYGVYGRSDSTDGYGVFGWNTATSGNNYGVYGRSDSTTGIGLYGWALAASGTTYGVYGSSASASGIGVYGTGYYGVYGQSGHAGYAGRFFGNVHATGNFSAGGAKAFKIDHPLDPANRYLYHFAQESPEVQNVYNGVVTLDAEGMAVVTLPEYFSALNSGAFRYQLTAIGAPMPNLYIARKIEGNSFAIAGGAPGMEVSWEVTAVRNDPYLRDHAAQAEVAKPADEQGKYQYPQGYGQPAEMGLDYQHQAPLDPVQEATPPPAGHGE